MKRRNPGWLLAPLLPAGPLLVASCMGCGDSDRTASREVPAASAEPAFLAELEPETLAELEALADAKPSAEPQPIPKPRDAQSDGEVAMTSEASKGPKSAVAPTQFNPLTPDEAYVILRKGTEPPGDGGYTLLKDPGTYICRQCNAELYRAEHKFESHCGWPSFDDEIEGAVRRHPDADGFRVEIVCSNCGGHLGHVFEGERMTEKNTRHCVNSISMRFIPEGKDVPAKIVIADK